jgi:hypothetical protein
VLVRPEVHVTAKYFIDVHERATAIMMLDRILALLVRFQSVRGSEDGQEGKNAWGFLYRREQPIATPIPPLDREGEMRGVRVCRTQNATLPWMRE